LLSTILVLAFSALPPVSATLAADSEVSAESRLLSAIRSSLRSLSSCAMLIAAGWGFCFSLSFCHISPRTCDRSFAADKAGVVAAASFATAERDFPNSARTRLSANRIMPTIPVAATRIKLPSKAKWLCRKCAVATPSTPPEPMGKPKSRWGQKR